MINYKPHSWNLLLLFKGSLIKRLLSGLIFIAILTTIFCFLHFEYKILNLEVSSALPGYMGAALGLLLVFRNNSAYDKWWEGRKILGALVNVSRNIAITVNNHVPASNIDRQDLVKLLRAFPYALKEHLREGVKLEELSMVQSEDMAKIIGVNHKPNSIVNLMQAKIFKIHKEGILNDMQQYLLIKNANELIDILGKCERIKKTPIPIAYVFLLKLFIVIYVVMLPLGLLETLGWSTIPLTLVLYYILMSIVLTAEEIEDPFGLEISDLPVDDIARNIDKNIVEIVAAKKTKELVEGVDV